MHFAIPAAWLSGMFLQRTLEAILRIPKERLTRPPFLAAWAIAGWSLLAALLFSSLPGRMKEEMRSVTVGGWGIEGDPVLEQVKAHGEAGQWIFTDDLLLAFHAGLPIPPELAVVPRKRIWPGQITAGYVVEILRKYYPEQIYLAKDRWNSAELDQFLEEHYESRQLGGGKWRLRKEPAVEMKQ